MRFKAFAIIPRKDEIEIKPLVMCRDCKWWKTHGATSEHWLPCMEMHTFPDWYCADGEKKREGTRRYRCSSFGTITREEDDDEDD